MYKDIIQFIAFSGVIAFWLWGCSNNHGLVAIGVPIVVFMYAAATGNNSKGPDEPRVGPFDGDVS